MTDVCFICWAIFIISSAIFSCKFWWYCRTESMLSSFVSLFLLPVNLQEKRLSKTSSLHGRHYMYSLYGLRMSSFGMIQVRDHSAIAQFEIERGWVCVDLLWDNNMRSTWSEKAHWGYESVVLIRPNIKQDTAICKLENHFYKRCTCMDCRSHHPYIYLYRSIYAR